MDLQGLADHAAMQSDRWLFVAALLVILAGLGFLWRWFTSDRKAIADRLTAITDRMIEQGTKTTEVVANNTAAMSEVCRVMRNCPGYYHPPNHNGRPANSD